MVCAVALRAVELVVAPIALDGSCPVSWERVAVGPNIGAKQPPPLIPPRQGEGVDFTLLRPNVTEPANP